MDKQFNFHNGRPPKITLILNEQGNIKVDWEQVNPVVFYGMLEAAKQAFADFDRKAQMAEVLKGN